MLNGDLGLRAMLDGDLGLGAKLALTALSFRMEATSMRLNSM